MPNRLHLPTLLLLLLGLTACGGGGGGGAAPTNLGLLAGTVPTAIPQTFPNPLADAATVTQVSASGPFAIDPADLPANVAGSGTIALDVVFSPTGPGAATGSITLAYTSAGGSSQVTYSYQATAELVVWSVSTPTLDFGLVQVGASSDLVAQFQNASSLSPVTLTSATLPNGNFSVDASQFPLTLDAGETASITFRFAPIGAGTHDGLAAIGPFDPGGPVNIQLVGSSPGGGQEEVTDYGTQSFFGGLTAPLTVDVPSDAISLTIECVGNANATYGLGELIGPGGKVYENVPGTGAYISIPGVEAWATTVPNTDRTDVQLVPGGGTYSFRVRRFSGSGSAQVRAIVERRPGGIAVDGILPLNVFLADGLNVTAATAPTDNRLQSILASMEQILSAQGITLGDIDYYDVTDPAYDVVIQSEFPQMLSEWSGIAAEPRMNLFFVETAIGGGVVGVSAALSGPRQNGTSVSGVMSVYGGFSTGTVGLIAAHELCHYLGLYHTVESTGSHDFIDDTAECPANGTNGACSIPGGGYLMHWQALGNTDISDSQGMVLRGHPLIEPGTGGQAKPGLASIRGTPAAPHDAWQLPQGWCGTCRICAGSR